MCMNHKTLQVTYIFIYVTLAYMGFFRLVLHGGGGGSKSARAFFSEAVKVPAIKLGTLTKFGQYFIS